MIKYLPVAILLFTTALVATPTEETTAVKKEGVGYIKMLGKALKSQLKQHLKTDTSALSAVQFCSTQAQTMTAHVNQKLPAYAKVRRTALKVRNLANKADETDIKVMESYIEKIQSGTFSPEDIEVVKVGESYRVYKPLLTQKVCLKCHGTTLNPHIVETIHKFYPKDQAIGFKEGDLRGVIVAEIAKSRK